MVLHRRFFDRQTLLYLDLGHAQLLLPPPPLDDLMRKKVLHGHRRLFGRGLHAVF